MRICVFGAGAVGGHIAARLAAAGHDLAVIARGAHLEAMRANGITLLSADERVTARVHASADAREIGTRDVVIVTLKTTGLAALAGAIAPLLGANTTVVFAQNGIPWWYAHGLSGTRPKPPELSRLDPQGALARAIAPERIIGAVVYSANEVVQPGVVQNHTPGSNVLTIGEPDDRASARIAALRAVLVAAHLHSPDVSDIRQVMWAKLVQNLGSSSLCLLAQATVSEVMADTGLRALRERVSAEGRAIAQAHGVSVQGAPPRPGAPRAPIQHKPSMLQDYELGRPMEVEAICQAPLWFARSAELATPSLDAVLALATWKAAAKGLYTAPAP